MREKTILEILSERPPKKPEDREAAIRQAMSEDIKRTGNNGGKKPSLAQYENDQV